jgi:selenocysteine-specific elongation factor
VREEVEKFIENTPMNEAPVVETSAATGEGLDVLREAITEVVAEIEDRSIGRAARLPVDRIFSMTGFGTVVTGTLWSGTIARDDRLEVLPGGAGVRVRGVEVHDEKVDKAYAGQRTAIALHGVDRSGIERGACVVTPGEFEAVSAVDTELYLLPSYKKKLKDGARIRFHLGSSETLGRVFVIGSNQAVPGEKTLVQVRLESPIVAAFGDRFVIRSYSPASTIGGGRVLDTDPGRHRKKDAAVAEFLGLLAVGSLEDLVEASFRRRPHGAHLENVRKRLAMSGSEAKSIADSLAGSGRLEQVGPGAFIHAKVLAGLEDGIKSTLTDYQARNKLEWGMSKEELREKTGVPDGLLNWVLDRLAAAGTVFARKGKVRTGSSAVELSPGEDAAMKTVMRLLEDRMFQTPSEADIARAARTDAATLRKVMSLLVEEGSVVKLDAGLYVHARAIEEARKRVTDYLSEHGEATVSELKGALGTTRKYAVPILEHLDRMGVTRRAADKRILI